MLRRAGQRFCFQRNVPFIPLPKTMSRNDSCLIRIERTKEHSRTFASCQGLKHSFLHLFLSNQQSYQHACLR